MAANKRAIDISTARRWARLKAEGMTTREIAQRFGFDVGTVNQQIKRAHESTGAKAAQAVATDAKAEASGGDRE
jgi:DNA-binding CsgD family transcriptional regulator